MKNKYSKKEMTLLTLYKLSSGKQKTVHYEDLLVETFKSYKKYFQLKKYPEYPDSDIFRYIIYFQLKPAGLIKIANKQCMLTELGIKESKNLLVNSVGYIRETDRMNKEIQRMFNLTGFSMFQENKINGIIDQDFYDFYKASVRTKPLELLGNINQVNDLLKEYSKKNKYLAAALMEYSNYLTKSFINLYEGIRK